MWSEFGIGIPNRVCCALSEIMTILLLSVSEKVVFRQLHQVEALFRVYVISNVVNEIMCTKMVWGQQYIPSKIFWR